MERPTKEELRERITEHLAHFGSNDASNVVWAGYLAGLLEWRLLDIEDYDSLRDLLRPAGEEELQRIFLGFETDDEE